MQSALRHLEPPSIQLLSGGGLFVSRFHRPAARTRLRSQTSSRIGFLVNTTSGRQKKDVVQITEDENEIWDHGRKLVPRCNGDGLCQNRRIRVLHRQEMAEILCPALSPFFLGPWMHSVLA